MDHEQAVQSQASMRYALGELTPSERDSFEEHFADCTDCMKDVESSTAFAANTRQVFREKASAGTRKKAFGWFAWRPFPALAFSAALNVALLAGLGVEFTRIHPTQPAAVADSIQPQNVEIVPVHAATRGGGQMQVVRVSRRPLVLTFDLPQSYEHYRYSVDRQGTSVMAGEVSVTGRPDSLNLQIPTSRLASGEYRVTLTGATASTSDNLGECLLQVEVR